MNKERWSEKLNDFKNALDRLEEGINEQIVTSLVIDGVIQRFEFNYELAWKIMRYFLEYQGIEEVKSPRSTFKEAFAVGLIENGEEWIDMLNDRNLTSHTYDEETAKVIFQKIKGKYYHNLRNLYLRLEKEALKQ